MRLELPLANLCSDCGRCCESIGLPPFEAANPEFGSQPVHLRGMTATQMDDAAFDTELFLMMPSELRIEHAERVLNLITDPSNRICVWYDTVHKCCKHYDWRPATCRRFEYGDGRCEQLRDDPTVRLVWQIPAPVSKWHNPRT